jgi:hypothetical protein
MVRHIRFVLVLGGNGLVMLSALLSLAAYSSRDGSGPQYIIMLPATALAGVAVLAGCALGVLSLRRPLVWTNLALALVALVLTAPWQFGGSGISDLPGGILAAALLPLAAVVTVAVVRGLGIEDCAL